MACDLLFPRHAEETIDSEDGNVIDFDKALGTYVQALDVYSQRAKILASNVVNADTVRLEATEPDHMQEPGSVGSEPTLLYRTAMQPSLDGNTVDSQTEIAAFSENALRYQTTLQFLSGKFKGMIAALKGE